MRKSLRVLLLSGCIALPFAGQTFAQGLSVGGENGISADVGIGGSAGVADVDASVGGSDGLSADANIGGGGGLDADAAVSLGGRNGVNAGLALGTGDGVDVGTTASVGGGSGSRAASAPDLFGLRSTGIGAAALGGAGAAGAPGAGALTGPQRQAFEAMSETERRNLLNRCADIASGGGDAALVSLCRMLRMSASR